MLKETGCLPPCELSSFEGILISNILFPGEYSEYTLVEDIPGFMNDYGMGLAFATTEVRHYAIQPARTL